ncbi:ATP-binding protein [Streptomyces sp. A2-16]|uniref:AlbA family DNA-binding domain-containing protein n=1 Tax=Streptomyces sp. A2-16 TaxID=2781734 RepID=UPI001BAFBB35|nr:ATP-binding protein [Streptomyces sp. A2-16]QUC56031.1 ATP-binding protein [Streptomyces sp. A2-16]
MTLNVSTERPFRSPRQLLELVTAIRDAGEHDENDWIEWKSTYDLTKKDVKATLARHIIGMGNRMPEKSSSICQGYSYIVIGVEPGSVEGVTSIDLADLDSGLQSYLGHQGPEWSASYVTLDGFTILVMTIEPPQMGDPIHTLNKEFGNYAAGMIFVRRSGRTVQANPGEVLSLTRRAKESTSSTQNMTLRPRVEPVEIPLWKLDEYLNQQLAARKEQVLHPANITRRSSPLGMASMDSRTEEDYLEEADEHLKEYSEYLLNISRQWYARKGAGELELTISNPDQISHQGVRVELGFPVWLKVILAEDYTAEEFTQPRPPEPLGTKYPIFTGNHFASSINIPYRESGEISTAIEPGSAVFNVASVRAEGHARLPKLHVIADSWNYDEAVITWAITALNSGGRAKGTIHLTQVGEVTISQNSDS